MHKNHPFIVAAVQMISSPDMSENFETAGRLVREAVDQGAKLVALPENFALMSEDEHAKIKAGEQDGTGPMQDFLADTAHMHGIYLVGGTIPLVSPNSFKVRNSCLGFGPDGKRLARYDKIHLFGFDNGEEHYTESDTVEAGSDVVTMEAPFGRIGLSVCYDLRFPELYREMGEVNLITIPAAFTYTTGLAHWEILLRARAIENQCYVVAPAQGGTHAGGRRTFGNSMIIDPWGAILSRIPEGPGVAAAEMSQQKLEQVRTQLPALQHRQLR